MAGQTQSSPGIPYNSILLKVLKEVYKQYLKPMLSQTAGSTLASITPSLETEAAQLTGGLGTNMVAESGAAEGLGSLGIGGWAAAAAPLVMTALNWDSLGKGRNYPEEMKYETGNNLINFANMYSKGGFDQNSLRDIYQSMHNMSTGANPKFSSSFSDADIDNYIKAGTGLDAAGLKNTLGYPDLPDFSAGDNSTLSNFMTGQLTKTKQAAGAQGLPLIGLAGNIWQEGNADQPYKDFMNNWDYWLGGSRKSNNLSKAISSLR
jgi:hypothetical protein